MSTEAGPIRILSVDDHPVLRQEIAALVAGQSDMRLLAEASDGREAIIEDQQEPVQSLAGTLSLP